MLAKAFADEHGRVSDKEADDDDEPKAKQLYPTFKSAAERRDAALAKYRTVESKYPGTGAAILARLAEASLLLDAGDAKGALGAYGDVRGSALAQADAEVRGRAIEGIGFANELLAQAEGADKGKHLDAALAAYRDLAQVDVKGLKELGLYHQARVVLAKGDKAKAIELLKEAHKLVSEPGDEPPVLVPGVRRRGPSARARSRRRCRRRRQARPGRAGRCGAGRLDRQSADPGDPAQLKEQHKGGGPNRCRCRCRAHPSEPGAAGIAGRSTRRPAARLAGCGTVETGNDRVNPERPLWLHQPERRDARALHAPADRPLPPRRASPTSGGARRSTRTTGASS